MQTIILIVSFLLTGLLATWAVTKGERDKKAKKLSKTLVSDYQNKTIDQIREMIEAESGKQKKNRVLILALNMVIENRLRADRKPFKFSDYVEFASYLFKSVFTALSITAFIGIILFVLSLVITIIQFSWIFVGIIFAITLATSLIRFSEK
jgi:hypothetical protein